MDGVTLRQRLRYEFDNTMSRGTGALVGWLAPEKSLAFSSTRRIALGSPRPQATA